MASPALSDAEVAHLKQLLGDKGELIFAQRSGSWSFGLNVSSSDIDYFGVFLAPDPLTITAHSLDHTASGAQDDWVLYELGRYIELLAKGNPKVVEPLFAALYTFTTPFWLQLRDFFRPIALNKTAVAQYISFVSYELHEARKKKQTSASAAMKPLYHALRLSREALAIAQGHPPRVLWEGADREELLAIRTGTTSKSFDELLAQANEEQAKARAALQDSTIPETFDMVTAGHWLVEERIPVLRRLALAEGALSSTSADPSQPQSSLPPASNLLTSASSSKIHLDYSLRLSNDVTKSPEWVRDILQRTESLLRREAIQGEVTVMCVTAMGSKMWKERLGRKFEPLGPYASPVPDYLVVYRQSVAELMNPLHKVQSFVMEQGGENVKGRGIWAIELGSAVTQLARHHVVFECLVALPNDERASQVSMWWHESYEPFHTLLRAAWRGSLPAAPKTSEIEESPKKNKEEDKGKPLAEVIPLGLISHYLGTATGLLRNPTIWPALESTNAAKSKSNGTGAVPQPQAEQMSDEAFFKDRLHACFLGRRLVCQARHWIPSDGFSAFTLLGDAEVCDLLQMKGESAPYLSPADSLPSPDAIPKDLIALRSKLLDDIAETQAELKKMKLPSDWPKRVRLALARAVRLSRFESLDLL